MFPARNSAACSMSMHAREPVAAMASLPLHQQLRPPSHWQQHQQRQLYLQRQRRHFLNKTPRQQGTLCTASAAGRPVEFATLPLPGRSGEASSTPAGTPGLQARLAGLGLAGVVAYGILNTVYYTVAFFVIWRYVARVPRGLGLGPTAAKFAEVVGLTWAGSQVTKVPRAGGAILLAPAVDGGLTALQGRLRLHSKRAAFALVLMACLLSAAAFYGSMLLLWA